MKQLPGFTLAGVMTGIMASIPAQALDQIIRPYESIRSAAMGGVVYTTGLYDENFWGNPARATANPNWRLDVVDLTVEGNSKLPTFVKDITQSGDAVSHLGETAGNNDHARLQTAMPALYLSTRQTGKMAYALGFLTNSQADIDLRNSFQINPGVVIDAGPAFTVAREFLPDDALSVGATLHADYRIATTQANYTFVNLLRGQSLAPSKTGGDGIMLDLDLGGTYKIMQLGDWQFSGAATLNEVFGGRFSSAVSVLKNNIRPPNEPRRGALGVSAERESLLILGHTSAAFEVSDIGNNPYGSFYRLLHLGGETRFHLLAFRLGINQGYLCAGIGGDFKFIEVDLATYGEEMSLNTGQFEDRRYALKFAIHI